MAREDNGIMTDLSNPSGWSTPAPLSGRPTQGSSMFGPGVPVMPVHSLERPRQFQYRPGINLTIIPRYGYGLADFTTLRNLSMACKEVRLNIELIKREVRSLEWQIVPAKKNDKAEHGAEIDEVQRALESPDGQMDFDSWVNAALEEVMVTDALSIYPNIVGDRLAALDLIDGTTIRPVLDYRGKVASPPAPGYIQVLYGMPAGYWTTDELIYRPMNASVNSPYGSSPIEFFMLAVNLALRRDTYHVGAYTEGNVPEALVGAPSTWDQAKVNTWQDYWDALVAGNITQQRRMHFIPLEGGRGSVPVYEFKKDNVDNTSQDEWLMKVACWAFGNSPQEFGLTTGGGLGGAGYAGAMADVHQRSMIQPVTQYLQRLFTKVIQVYLRKPHLKFQWIGLDPAEDTFKQAQVDQINVALGVYDLAFIQEREGIPQEHRPVEAPQAEQDPFSGMAKRWISKAQFEEGKHPRADDGKFGSGGGSGGSSGQSDGDRKERSDDSTDNVVKTDPRDIEPVNSTDPDKVELIAARMKEKGWQGAPILAFKDGDRLQAITGSHRIVAAREVGIDVPVNIIDTSGFTEKDADAFLGANHEEELYDVMRGLKRKGLVSGEQLKIMRAETKNSDWVISASREHATRKNPTEGGTNNPKSEPEKGSRVNAEGKDKLDAFLGELKGKYKNVYQDASDKELDQLEALERDAFKKSYVGWGVGIAKFFRTEIDWQAYP